MSAKFQCCVCDGSGEIPPHWHNHVLAGRLIVGGTWCPWCEGAKYLSREKFIEVSGEEPGDEDTWEGDQAL